LQTDRLLADEAIADSGLVAMPMTDWRRGFLGRGLSALIPDSRFVAQRTQASIRLGHTLRF
jgi:hypothetical protein